MDTPLQQDAANESGRGLVPAFVFCVALAGLAFAFWTGDNIAYVLAGLQLLYTAMAWFRVRRRFDGEEADSLYFLGFLFTVSLLAFSFVRFKAGVDVVRGTLQVVGQGLFLTVLGLFCRQVAILSAPHELEGAAARVATPDTAAPTSVHSPAGETAGAPQGEASDAQFADATKRAASHIRRAAHRLRVAAGTISDAQGAIVEAVERVRTSAVQLDLDVREAGNHIRGGAQSAAGAIVQAGKDIKSDLDAAVASLSTSGNKSISALREQREALLKVAEVHGTTATNTLDRLQKAAEAAEKAAAAAIKATEEASRALAERAQLIPDPSGPAQKYAEALMKAGLSIDEARGVVVGTSNEIARTLNGVNVTLTSVSEEAVAVAERQREALQSVRGHFELFRTLQNEYVDLVQELLARDRWEKK